MNFAGAKFSFLKKYRNENTLEIQLGNELRKDFLNSEITLFNSLNQNIDFIKEIEEHSPLKVEIDNTNF